MDKQSVLIVEDDQYLLSLYARKFSDKGFMVYSARDGLSAWRTIEKYHPQAAVVDLNIPELSGWDLLRLVAESPEPKPLCVVLSNYDRATAEENEPIPDLVRAYFVKINTDPDELVDSLKKLLQKQ